MILRPHLRQSAQWLSTPYHLTRHTSTQPPLRPYKPAPPRETPPPVAPSLPPVRRSLLSRLLGRKEPIIEDYVAPEPPDPARGRVAAERVVREGILDPRYKEGAKRYTRLIVASPIAIFLTYELYRRRFLGVEQKVVPAAKAEETGEGVKEGEVGWETGREGG